MDENRLDENRLDENWVYRLKVLPAEGGLFGTIEFEVYTWIIILQIQYFQTKFITILTNKQTSADKQTSLLLRGGPDKSFCSEKQIYLSKVSLPATTWEFG